MTKIDTDPRPQMAASLDQVQLQVNAVTANDLDRPTPCSDYDVRALLGHILAVLRKMDVIGRDGNAAEMQDPVTDTTDTWANEIRRARAVSDQLWNADELLEHRCTLPWATMSGRDFLDAYAHEFTVHAWDLAQATGRVDKLDPWLAEVALDWYSRNMPPETRVEGVPFGRVIAVANDVDVYTKLAAFVGREP